MNIFLSHSMADKELINNIKLILEPHGLKFFIAEHTIDTQRTITEKIESLIRKSNFALVLLTENGFNSHFVQQEIGYLKSLGKPFLQVVQEGIEKKIKGFNFGRDYIQLDSKNPSIAIDKIKEVLLVAYKKLKRQKTLAQKKRTLEFETISAISNTPKSIARTKGSERRFWSFSRVVNSWNIRGKINGFLVAIKNSSIPIVFLIINQSLKFPPNV